MAVANTAADQLRGAGIAASVLPLEPPVLYSTALLNNQVDAIVGWSSAGGDLATLLASRFGCPALVTAPVSAVPVPGAPGLRTPVTGTPGPSSLGPSSSGPSSSGPSLSSTADPPPGNDRSAEDAPPVRAPSNLTGICDRGIQPLIDGALDGSRDISAVISAVEPRLWAMATVLPIMQDTTIVAAAPGVRNVSLTGAVPVGIVEDAGSWVKVNRWPPARAAAERARFGRAALAPASAPALAATAPSARARPSDSAASAGVVSAASRGLSAAPARRAARPVPAATVAATAAVPLQ